MKVETKEVV